METTDSSSPTPPTTWPLHRPTQRGPWSPSSSPANGHAHTAVEPPGRGPHSANFEVDPSHFPSSSVSLDKISLDGISIRAAFLGAVFGAALVITLLLAISSSPFWRAPFFLATLALFHFLEYYVTARYNKPAADTSAFLLTTNGWTYNLAHTLALTECILSYGFLPDRILPAFSHYSLLTTGFTFLIIGQATRSAAMVQAATNFNHIVQHERKRGHGLVTDGIYSWLRHPSYFGFWWWALGTQLVLGNAVCFVGYAFVLWRFFRSRITSESKHLLHISQPSTVSWFRF
jgi:protein-S-isoprenylcysteine O-methyltransferase